MNFKIIICHFFKKSTLSVFASEPLPSSTRQSTFCTLLKMMTITWTTPKMLSTFICHIGHTLSLGRTIYLLALLLLLHHNMRIGREAFRTIMPVKLIVSGWKQWEGVYHGGLCASLISAIFYRHRVENCRFETPCIPSGVEFLLPTLYNQLIIIA